MADLLLRKKQVAWETPRNIAILAGAVAAFAAAIGGWTGYRIASAPPPTIIVHLDAPLFAPQPAPRP